VLGREKDRVGRPRRITRRDFLKWSAAAGLTSTLAGMGVLSALGIVRGPQEPVPAWEVEPGVVDYDLVPEGLSGPTPNILKVAQWYDYWPGSFLVDFETHIRDTYGLEVNVQDHWDIYTSNEELFHWLTINKRRYDLIFPSNYFVDLMKKTNMIYTLNDAWLPNLGAGFSNMMSGLVNVPAGNPYDRRNVNGEWQWVSVPYFWGTTGIGFRTDKLPVEEIKELGWDVFWMDSYQPRAPGYERVELRKKMRMLDDQRDVIGTGLKKAGWEWQKAQGWIPTGRFPPDGPQWTTNDTEPEHVKPAGDLLFAAKPNLFDFNSTDQSTSLIGGSAVLNMAWSGDMMYAIQPNANVSYPVEYIIPRQGSSWWVDCAAIHSKSRNLWLAHQFLNFIHDPKQNMALTKWNLYSTPNQLTFDALPPFPNGYNMKDDARLYPNIYAPEDFRICDFAQDIGLDALLNLYNPLWFDLTTD